MRCLLLASLLVIVASSIGFSQAADPLKGDLAKLGGKWELQRPSEVGLAPPVVRVVKEVRSNRETVTHYDQAGEVVRSHVADFRLESSGRVRLFIATNLEVTAGEGKGMRISGPISYVYRLAGDAFYEVQGALADTPARAPVRLSVWKRVNE